MTTRPGLLKQVTDGLGSRQLVWAGLRGDDIEPLLDVPQLAASYSISGAFSGRPDVQSVAYEDMMGRRVDFELWDIDGHPNDPTTAAFRRGLLGALSTESALLPYRPSEFLSAIHFARRDRCLSLGMFGAQQSAFEHKPFVESAVADLGIPHIPWRYIADDEQLLAYELAGAGSLVLRRSRTSGGEGVLHVDGPNQIKENWPKQDEAFVSVAPFIGDAIPVNVGATVWANADPKDCVTVHHPSLQLIGIESCVSREFGYAGNDFGASRTLDDATIVQIEASTKRIGVWLRSNGYVGTFGVDFLVKDGVPLFTEVNARFQGSTSTSCRLAIEHDEQCLMLEHVAAWLGIEKQGDMPLLDRVRDMGEASNVVVHWTGSEEAELDAASLYSMVLDAESGTVRADGMVSSGMVSEPGSLVARFHLGRRVTTTGFDLDPTLDATIREWARKESL